MARHRLLRSVAWVGVGLAAAAWWTRSGPSSPATDALTRLIDWSEWDNLFRVRNARSTTRLVPSVSPTPFAVVAFEAEALGDFPGRFFEARLLDTDGVPLRGPAPQIMMEPDYALEEPWKWTSGSRSHGWFAMPDPETRRRIGKILISTARP